MQVGYLGVGNMGQPMASQLLDGGHDLVLYDISETAMEPLLLQRGKPRDEHGEVDEPRAAAERRGRAMVGRATGADSGCALFAAASCDAFAILVVTVAADPV